MSKKDYFQISTAIDYPSGRPHCGHMYEKICADVIARWKRLDGFKVHFSTGIDEHGLKIERAAQKAVKDPQEFVDEMSSIFRELCTIFNISYNDFIRTTEKRHEKTFIYLFNKIKGNGFIYEDSYKGPYCVDCETFYTEKDLINGKCPVHKKPVEILEEIGYFFKLSSFQNKLIDYYKKVPDFVTPQNKKKEILNRLKEPLKDLSITRKSVKWGIKVPGKDLVFAVWQEALTNYLTTIKYPNKEYKNFWPAYHVIGHDIMFHHTILWDSWLMAAGIELPKVIVHGFINLKGEKMSKSSGLVLDPFDLAKKYPVDAIRYYLIKDVPFGQDLDFSEEALKNRLNNELANELGNLLSRTLTLVEKNFTKIEKTKIDSVLSKKLNLEKIRGLMEKYELHNALSEIFKFISLCNKYINDKKPWEINDKEKLKEVLYNLLESLRIVSILLSPFIHETTNKINKQLNVKASSLKDCKFGFIKDYKVKKGEILFQKIK